MDISVIIVNYNVQFFLEQCLFAVQKALLGIRGEIIVVDNASTDGSIAYLQPKFPKVQFIVNAENVGFGKANNQALCIAKGKYVLFLNPDTIVPEDCFTKCIHFFEQTPNCGAIGVKMLDGKGIFLPESKRAFPSPMTSFFKLVGLASFFPKSPVFNRYALGYLDENKNHEVDVLAGAFMMLSKPALEKVQGFDDTFFMYGEDVDLSYRIQQAGFKNYYFSETSIIHFKGESTKRGSLNYVRMFYQAMSVFVKKHYTGSTVFLFSFLIQLAIGFRAIVSLFSGLLTKWSMVLIDAAVVYSSLWLVEKNWVKYVRDGGGFNEHVIETIIPSFTLIFLITAALSGMYDKLYKPSKAFIASLSSMIVLLAVYSLLPENFRFSRGVVLTGGIVAGVMITLVRWILIELKWVKENDSEEKKYQQTVVVGNEQEYNHVVTLMQQAGLQERILGRIKTNGDITNAIGDINNLLQLLKHLSIREVIFCEGYLSYQQIIHQLVTLPKNINYRFIAHNSSSIVGSDSKATSGEALTAEGFYLLNQPYQRRMKRLTDVFLAIVFLLTFPVHYVFVKKGWAFLIHVCQVLIGKKTWIGYIIPEKKLPSLVSPVLTHYGLPFGTEHPLTKDSLSKLDMVYARNFDWMQDIKIIFRNYRYLGGK